MGGLSKRCLIGIGLAAAVALLAGCSGPAPVSDVDGGLDGGTDDGGTRDAGRRDGGTRDAGPDARDLCAQNRDCDDGLFCNGEEVCAPARETADERGCAPAEAAPCVGLGRCDEGAGVCCDADGDGHDALGCGGDDCDDLDADRFPGNIEICDAEGHDEDCNPATFGTRDADADGFVDAACCNDTAGGAPICGDDCDDSRSDRYPGLVEACDGRDNDCDGDVDEGVTAIFYRDADGDGYGTAADTIAACSTPAGYSTLSTDCDDSRAEVHPGATEVCDGTLDHDCDGTVDEGCGCTSGATRPCGPVDTTDGSWLTTGACETGSQQCLGGIWSTSCPGAVYPTTEVCDGVDNDCDGSTDESGAGSTVFYRDADGDGYGRIDMPLEACSLPAGYAVGTGDCDDGNPAVRPGAPETCNGLDDDCNGLFDGAGEDDDGDGYADASCGGDDCDDTRPMVRPGAVELCNAVDDDCDGLFDGPGEDDDGDGFIDPACGGDDCDDTRRDVHPGAVERCDGVDNDCDGGVDEEPASTLCPLLPHAASACSAGACVATCSGSWLECTAAPGCETDGTTLLDCGACGRACTMDTCLPTGCNDAVEIDVGGGHSCARRASGQVVCWGRNTMGQLGDGTTTDRYTFTDVAGLTDAIDISAGVYHSCAVRSGGQAVCWGSNSSGQLGDGTAIDRLSFVNVTGLTDAVEISVGSFHSCARRASGQVVCWGWGMYGQLGDGSWGSYTFVNVTGLSDAVEISAGSSHSCARRASGQAVCWGYNVNGQIGDGSTTERRTYANVTGLSDAVDISASHRHTCAVRAGGQAVCWGANSGGVGGLGDGTTADRTTFVNVTGLTDAVGVAAGSWSHTCAVRSGGQLVCWGTNIYGQLGDGTTTDRLTFVDVTGGTDGLEVVAGSDFSCARRAPSQVVCWGGNLAGQLGDGTTVDRLTPVNLALP